MLALVELGIRELMMGHLVTGLDSDTKIGYYQPFFCKRSCVESLEVPASAS